MTWVHEAGKKEMMPQKVINKSVVALFFKKIKELTVCGVFQALSRWQGGKGAGPKSGGRAIYAYRDLCVHAHKILPRFSL
jgi:hypothetical protein